MAQALSQRGRGPRLALVLCLGALFFVLSASVALLSGSVYRSTVAAGDTNFTHRTALSYLVNQVRRADAAGAVAVGFFGDSGALRLTEALDSGAYETILYCYDGQLMELYAEAGSGLGPADGMAVMALESMSVGVDGGLLCLRVTAGEGESWSVSISPRCGVEEVGPL